MSDWYERSFGEDYLLVYKHRDQRGARREVEKLIAWLNLPPGAKVLDLCCGMGRHSLAFAEAGYEVTGVDLSEVLLREAKRNDSNGSVQWMKADMRNLPLAGGFDAVVNLFTSFGYFHDDHEHVQVLREVARMLKPGGGFIIDYLNPAYTAAQLVARSERVDGDQFITERRVIEDGYVKKHITITKADSAGEGVDGGRSREYMERIKLYSKADFAAMLQEAGLILEQVHGDYGEDAYDPETSPRMILAGNRP
ncbi:class I SAM-dependent methyltransferase [Paenibacillus macerans]|uniref:class I SAM-dependent methyltransferase n=1 Tax=Paenibacillus macerans TaxID=44252 RepID=UPI00203CE8F1|nr:class I SAM-dependent methyltransferase [Paenibacillus macerans]MCM3700430.1 methyltransferase domain-containing protein [Paenibacillus macerans]